MHATERVVTMELLAATPYLLGGHIQNHGLLSQTTPQEIKRFWCGAFLNNAVIFIFFFLNMISKFRDF